MVKIQLKESYIADKKLTNFNLILGSRDGGTFYDNHQNTYTNAKAIIVSTYSPAMFTDEIFFVIVSSSTQGNNPEILNNILMYVTKGVIEVIHNNIALTPKQIVEFAL